MVTKRTLTALFIAALLVPSAAVAQDTTSGKDATGVAGGAEGAEEAAEPATEESVEEGADATLEAADASEDDEDSKDWSVTAALSSTVGQGTFVDPSNDTEFADEVGPGDNAFDRWNLAYVLVPAYSLGDFSLNAEIAWVQWLTDGGGYNEPNEFRFQDIAVNGSWAGYTIEPLDLNVSAGASLGLPTSDMSQVTTQIVDTSLSGSLSRTFFDRLTLSYTLAGGKIFHEFTSPVIESEEDDEILDDGASAEGVVFRAGGSEDLGSGLVAIGGMNTEFYLANALGASIQIWDKLSGSVSWSLTTFWTYDLPEGGTTQDGVEPDTADIEGINEGRGVGQIQRASVGVSYPILHWLDKPFNSVNAGLSLRTAQLPKTDDNKSFNFPFWNFDGAASNASSIRLSLSGTY